MAEGMVAKGLQDVVVDDTWICKIIGDQGKLYYYGYSIHDLAEHCTYEEVVFLLLKGKLPNRAELDQITRELKEARGLPYGVRDVIKSAPKGSIPMDVLRTAASALALTDPKPGDDSPEGRYRKAIRMVALFPEIVAADYRFRRGEEPVASNPKLNHAANFLYLLHGKEPGADAARTMDVALVLHAEHDFNASTFTARVIAATMSDMYSAVTGAIGALKGPLHGGANEGVIKTLLEIGEPANIKPWLAEKFKDKNFRLMGFGHRVYKTLDPRAIVLKKYSEKTGRERGTTKWFEMSNEIEQIMKTREKPLYPNVDFYSASTYFMMGLPPEIYTPIFAVARVVGWCAHVIEQQTHNKLIRPAADYHGEIDKPLPPIDKR
ncbi:MAG: citrate synthase [Planctomycetes bacterium]|jgi:citrate synthase|nr:citrate synthase [Planctomycetota bacterium]MCL4729311.1 citrate synthase [Planctomycetota bacterium]